MYDIDNNSYNSIILHKNSRNKKRKIMCVICYPKVELALVNEDEGKWKCPRCKNDYFILGQDGDLVPEDILESSHVGEDEGAVLLRADSEFIQQESDSGKIKRPAYMQDSATTKVTYYREE
jgi:hypothetical protein